MKILVNYLGRTGSGPLMAFEMVKVLLENGHEVTALLSTGISNREEWEALPQLRLYFIQTYTDKKSLITGTMRFFIKERHKIQKTFSSEYYDMLYVPMCHLWGHWIDQCFPNCRKVVTVHDPKPHTGANPIESYLFAKQCRQADDLVVLSRRFIPDVQRLYKKAADRVHYIPHGVEPAYRRKQREPSPIHFASDKTNFVFVGRIEAYKGIGILTQAFKKLMDNRRDATLTVAGKGDLSPYADEFAALPQTTVINRYIEDEELGWFFDGPNIVNVLPYLDATQSGNVPIAMEYNCTLLASRTGGLQEQINDGVTGVLVEPGNAEALFNGMLWIMENPEQCVTMRANYPMVLEGLQWPILSKQLTDIVKSCREEHE